MLVCFFGHKQDAHRRYTRVIALGFNWEVCPPPIESYKIYSEAKRQFSVRKKDVLTWMPSLFIIKWWSTFKSAVFGTSSSLPPLVEGVVDWWASLFLRLVCWQIILTASSPVNQLICRSLAIRILNLPNLLSGPVRSVFDLTYMGFESRVYEYLRAFRNILNNNAYT